VGLSSENPDVLGGLVEERDFEAAVHDGVVDVVGGDDLVIASGDERTEFDLEVSLFGARVHDIGDAKATSPLAGAVYVEVVVSDSEVAVSLKRVLSGVADARLVHACDVTGLLVPKAEVCLDVEVLLNAGVLAGTFVGASESGGREEGGESEGEHVSNYVVVVMYKLIND